jgi:hypothetical protein
VFSLHRKHLLENPLSEDPVLIKFLYNIVNDIILIIENNGFLGSCDAGVCVGSGGLGGNNPRTHI